MPEKRVMQGYIFSHGGQTFAFLETSQPYDLTGCRMVLERAAEQSGGSMGTIIAKIVEVPKMASHQGFAIIPDGLAGRRMFRDLLNILFPDCEFQAQWVTDFSDPPGILQWGLKGRSLILYP